MGSFGPTSFPLFHGLRAGSVMLVSIFGSFGLEPSVCGFAALRGSKPGCCRRRRIVASRATAVIGRPGLIGSYLTYESPGKLKEYGPSAVPEKFLGVVKESPCGNPGVSPKSTDPSSH